MLRITVTAVAPDRESIGRAASVLRAGGVAAIPTDTLYGLAANPFDVAAINKLFTIKRRDLEKAIPWLRQTWRRWKRQSASCRHLARDWRAPSGLVR